MRIRQSVLFIILLSVFVLLLTGTVFAAGPKKFDNKFHGVYGDYEQHLEFSGAAIRQIPDLHPVMTKEQQSNRVTRALMEESAKKDWFAMVQPGQELKLLYTLKTSKPLSVQMQTSRTAFISPFKVVDGKDQTIKEKVVETKSVKVNDNMDKTELKMAVPKGIDGVRVTMIDTVYYGKKFTTVMYLFTNMDAADEYFKRRFGVKCPLEPASKSVSGSKTAKGSDKNNKSGSVKKQEQDSDDSGGLGTVGKVGIGLAAAGAIGFGVTHLGGGGGAGAGAGSGPAGPAEAETPPAPPEPESFVFTDPATGAQSLYEKDPETGQWVNPLTGGIVDIGDLGRFAKQRQADADWTRGQMEKLSNRDTDLDKAWREQDAKTDEEMQKKFEEIDRQGARDRVSIKSGTYGMSEEERAKYLTDRQERLQKNSEADNRSAKNWDRITKTAEVVKKAADIAVDGLSVATGPAGQLVADVYSMTSNVAGSTSEAITKGESVWGGIGKGIAKGGADVFQNRAGDKWVKKLGTYIGTETAKEIIVATIDGENVLKAAQKGLVNGTFKYAVSEIGDNISAGYGKQNENLMKQHYKEIRTVWSKDISQKSVNALQSMNFQKYFGKETTRELAQGFGQSLTKEIGATTYDVGVEGKSVTESLFDDKKW